MVCVALASCWAAAAILTAAHERAHQRTPHRATRARTKRRHTRRAGKKAQSFMDQGVLVPDEVVVEMVRNRLAQDDVQQRGWLLDGYPRSASQAEAIEAEGIRPDCFLLIDVREGVGGGG
jgi:adenylate kinase family enzyme